MRMRFLQRHRFGAAFAAVVAGAAVWGIAAGMADDPLPRVTFHTTEGDITLELYVDHAPKTVENFVFNCKLGIYEGVGFCEANPEYHYVYAGAHLADGSLKTCPRGYRRLWGLDRENRNGLLQVRGAVSIRTYGAGDDKANDSHEMMFCLGRCERADGVVTVFARVIEGLDLLDAIAASVPANGEVPTLRPTIVSVDVVEVE